MDFACGGVVPEEKTPNKLDNEPLRGGVVPELASAETPVGEFNL